MMRFLHFFHVSPCTATNSTARRSHGTINATIINITVKYILMDVHLKLYIDLTQHNIQSMMSGQIHKYYLKLTSLVLN